MEAKPTNECLNVPDDCAKFPNILRVVLQHIVAQAQLKLLKKSLSRIATCADLERI